METDMTDLASLADLYAYAKAEADAAKKRVDDLREQILAAGVDQINGDRFLVSVNTTVRASIDTTLVRELLSKEDLALVTKETPVATIRVKAAVRVAA
jgi:hypothetical protein